METESLVRNVLRDLEIDDADVDGATRLREDLEVDSTELVEIAVAIERALSLKIDTDEFLALKTFQEMVNYVEQAPRHG